MPATVVQTQQTEQREQPTLVVAAAAVETHQATAATAEAVL
jgi:hypothetical protein